MTIPLRLSMLCALLLSSCASVRQEEDAPQVVWRSGYLDAHWEYPNFLPDSQFEPGAFRFRFRLREAFWQDRYSERVNYARIHHPDETVCFRVSGEGYFNQASPDAFPPNYKDEFVFVQISELTQEKSEMCAERFSTNKNGSVR